MYAREDKCQLAYIYKHQNINCILEYELNNLVLELIIEKCINEDKC